MDDSRAKELLKSEREQVETALARIRDEGREGSDAQDPAGDLNNEGLYEDELSAGREQDLQRRLDAIDRAEESAVSTCFRSAANSSFARFSSIPSHPTPMHLRSETCSAILIEH